MASNTKHIVDKINAAFAANDIEGVLSWCADDITWTMVGDGPIVGKDAVRKWIRAMDMEPPRFTVNNTVAEGDFVTSIGEMTMKGKDGKVVPYAYCDVYRFRDGKVVELKAFVMPKERQHDSTAVA